MNGDLILSLLAATVLAGTPLLYATLGEIVTERSGVINLGVEGMMILGAFFAFIVQLHTGNAWLAALAAGLGAGCVGLLHGVVCLIFQGNQTVSGLALTIFGVGLSDYLGTPFVGVQTEGFQSFALPVLGQIPVLGPVFSSITPWSMFPIFCRLFCGVFSTAVPQVWLCAPRANIRPPCPPPGWIRCACAGWAFSSGPFWWAWAERICPWPPPIYGPTT